MALPVPTLAIGEITVRQLDGLFSLNDLHKAAGSEKRHQPSDFLKIDQTKALLAEIGNSEDSRSLVTKEGRNGGTYACRELVIAYAAWISAAFHLQVIRVFLAASAPTPALVTPAPMPVPDDDEARLARALRLARQAQAALDSITCAELRAAGTACLRQMRPRASQQGTWPFSTFSRHDYHHYLTPEDKAHLELSIEVAIRCRMRDAAEQLHPTGALP